MQTKYATMIKRIIKYFSSLRKSRSEWEYGTCRDRVARRHRKRGNVQFILWKAGEQGHKEDWWCDFDSSWWEGFIVNNK